MGYNILQSRNQDKDSIFSRIFYTCILYGGEYEWYMEFALNLATRSSMEYMMHGQTFIITLNILYIYNNLQYHKHMKYKSIMATITMQIKEDDFVLKYKNHVHV